MRPQRHVLSDLDLSDLDSIRRVAAALYYNLTHIVLSPGRPEIRRLQSNEHIAVTTIIHSIQGYPQHTLLLHATLLFIDDVGGSDDNARRAVEEYIEVASEQTLRLPWLDEESYNIVEGIFFQTRDCRPQSREQLEKLAPAAFFPNQLISSRRAGQLEDIAVQTNRRVMDIPADEALAPLPQGALPNGIQTFNSGPCENCERWNRSCNMVEPFCWECRSTWTVCRYSYSSKGPRLPRPLPQLRPSSEESDYGMNLSDETDNSAAIEDTEAETEIKKDDSDPSYEASGEYSSVDDDVDVLDGETSGSPTIAGRFKRGQTRTSLRPTKYSGNFKEPTIGFSSGSELSDAPSTEENPFSDLDVAEEENQVTGDAETNIIPEQVQYQLAARPEMEGNADAVEGGIGGPVSSKVEVTDGDSQTFTALYTSFTDRAIDDGTLDRTPPVINKPFPSKQIITFRTETSHRDTSVTTTIATYHYLGITDWADPGSIKRLRTWRSEITTRFFGQRRQNYEKWTETERDALFEILQKHMNPHGRNQSQIGWADVASQLNATFHRVMQRAKDVTAEIVYQFTDNRGAVRQVRCLRVPLGRQRIVPSRDGEEVRLAMMQFTHPLAAEIMKGLVIEDEED